MSDERINVTNLNAIKNSPLEDFLTIVKSFLSNTED